MGLGHSPSIVVDGLVFMIDPSNTNCYSGYGNTVYNLVNSSIGATFVGYTSNPIDNTENRSIYFDGSTNYLDFGSSSIFKLTDNFTLSCWVKSNVYGDRAILGNFGPSSNYSGFNLCIQPSNKFAFLTGSQSSAPNATYLYADNTFNLNTWYHVTGLRRNGTNYLYINGVLQSSTNTQVVASSAQNFYLARWYSNLTGYYHSGQIGIASLYNRALSSDEILQNYNATKKKYNADENIVTNGLILKLDAANINSYSGVGTVWNDLSGFGNTFYLFNGPTFSSSKGGFITFDGTNDYARSYSNSTILQSTTTFSVDLIFKYKNTDTNLHRLLGFSDLENSLDMWITSSTRRNCFDDDSGLVSFKTLENNDYTHLTYIVSPSEKRLYFNGVLERSVGGRTHAPSTDYLTIAKRLDSAYNCNMDVNLIQIYNRALTEQEILQNYNATKNRFINALPPVRNGLVLELDAGQRASYPGTGNTWYDLSGNSLNGTLTNGPTFSGIGATSNIVFDGSNDYVNIGNSISNTFSSLTIEAIVKIGIINKKQVIVSTYNSGLGWGLELLDNTSSNKFNFFGFTSAGVYTSVQSSSSAVLNQTYHITAVYSGSSSLTLYLNSLNDSTVNTNYSSIQKGASTNLQIGDDPDGSQNLYYQGNIYTTRLFNRALSAYEVKQNFDYYRTRYNI